MTKWVQMKTAKINNTVSETILVPLGMDVLVESVADYPSRRSPSKIKEDRKEQPR